MLAYLSSIFSVIPSHQIQLENDQRNKHCIFSNLITEMFVAPRSGSATCAGRRDHRRAGRGTVLTRSASRPSGGGRRRVITLLEQFRNDRAGQDGRFGDREFASTARMWL